MTSIFMQTKDGDKNFDIKSGSNKNWNIMPKLEKPKRDLSQEEAKNAIDKIRDFLNNNEDLLSNYWDIKHANLKQSKDGDYFLIDFGALDQEKPENVKTPHEALLDLEKYLSK